MATILFVVVLGGAVTLFAHPDGRRWLERWELGRVCTPAEVTQVVRHFRRRRVIALVVVVVSAATLRGAEVAVVAPGMLVAVLVAELRDRRGPRSRVMAPLVPRWARRAVGYFAVAVVLGLLATAWLTRWARSSSPSGDGARAELPPTFALTAVATAVTVAAVALVVHLASTRASITGVDDDVDLLLRARAARVATGLGCAVLGYLLSVTGAYVTDRLQPLTVPAWMPATSGTVQVIGVIVGIVAWICVANPPTKPVLVHLG